MDLVEMTDGITIVLCSARGVDVAGIFDSVASRVSGGVYQGCVLDSPEQCARSVGKVGSVRRRDIHESSLVD
jgi:hypothetical protein